MTTVAIHHMESYFQLRPASSGLISPPDPSDRSLVPGKHVYGKPVRQAAVLVPLIHSPRSTSFNVLLTLRTKHLRSHAGQVSLPGGSMDPEDKNAKVTALRETEEEVAIKPDQVRVLGIMPSIILPSAYQVTPVVGVIDSRVAARSHPNPDEVAEIFQAPASLLFNPNSYQLQTMEFRNKTRKFWELHYQQFRIWGATAAILRHLAEEMDEHIQNSQDL